MIALLAARTRWELPSIAAPPRSHGVTPGHGDMGLAQNPKKSQGNTWGQRAGAAEERGVMLSLPQPCPTGGSHCEWDTRQGHGTGRPSRVHHREKGDDDGLFTKFLSPWLNQL